MKQAGNPGKHDGVHDICAYIDLGWKAVEQEKQHHNDAAGAD